MSILDHIGNTPLVQIRNITRHLPAGVEIHAKLESFNPGGSVKDRAAYWMIKHGIKTGELIKDKTILDATSGNTGIAYAMIAAVLGYKVELVMPENVSPRRRDIVLACGAKITYSSKFEGSDGAILLAKKIYEENKEKYFMPDQYNNPMNPQAHYDSTAPEIWRQTGGRLTHFVATIGTSGTAMGCSKRLKEYNPKIHCIGVQPKDALHGLEGLKHISSAIVPGIYDESLLDGAVWVETEEAYDMTERLIREEGLLVGHSSGAALAACLKVAQKIDKGVIVTVFPDHGDRYVWE